MAVDDSFKKPGAIPFKWEVRPGVPKAKAHHHHHQQSSDCMPSLVPPQQLQKQQKEPSKNPNHTSPDTPRKLAPPPAGLYFQPQVEPRSRSFLSVPRTRSERYRFYHSSLAQPENVLTGGCFPSSPLLIGRKNDKKKMQRHKLEVERKSKESEPDCDSDLETLFRWSISSRKSFSPFRDSPLSSSFSSHRTSPRSVNDAELAVAFGYFN